uniref:Methylenetetrahydrofolate dehydrogenase n=1 Tax=Schizophyllum commune (strain H4-8 / FGSC 9210) TaxID=578458 RepID=D8PQY8_SCHCM
MAAAPKGVLLKADPIAATFREEVKTALAQRPRPPKLVGILATAAAPSRFYADFTRKQCEDLGFQFELRTTGAAKDAALAEGEGVEEAIIEANEDEGVDGIMVYFPIFGSQQDHYLQQVVSPLKDVEGLHFKFHYNLYHKYTPPPGTFKSIIPCTPLAVVKTLEHAGVYNKLLPYGDRAYGKTIVVINRSEVVGRPLAALLANDGARVFSVDIDSIQEYTKRPRDTEDAARRYHPRHVVHPCSMELKDCLAIADVVVSAVPSPSYKVKTAWLKDGCVCVNVAADKNFEADVREKASLYVPAVGKVTILMLLRNL